MFIEQRHREELVLELDLIVRYAAIIPESKIIKLQEENDDGDTDGIIGLKGGEIQYVEARRKGFPNHSGETTRYSQGWETPFLRNGIFLNELAIRKYITTGFVFLVEIKNCKPRFANINPQRVAELLKQPPRSQRSTNSHNHQSVKLVPLEWFVEV
jgi:hypothetical protein